MTLKTPETDAQVKAPLAPDRPAPRRIPFRERLRLPDKEYLCLAKAPSLVNNESSGKVRYRGSR